LLAREQPFPRLLSSFLKRRTLTRFHLGDAVRDGVAITLAAQRIHRLAMSVTIDKKAKSVASYFGFDLWIWIVILVILAILAILVGIHFLYVRKRALIRSQLKPKKVKVEKLKKRYRAEVDLTEVDLDGLMPAEDEPLFDMEGLSIWDIERTMGEQPEAAGDVLEEEDFEEEEEYFEDEDEEFEDEDDDLEDDEEDYPEDEDEGDLTGDIVDFSVKADQPEPEREDRPEPDLEEPEESEQEPSEEVSREKEEPAQETGAQLPEVTFSTFILSLSLDFSYREK